MSCIVARGLKSGRLNFGTTLLSRLYQTCTVGIWENLGWYTALITPPLSVSHLRSCFVSAWDLAWLTRALFLSSISKAFCWRRRVSFCFSMAAVDRLSSSIDIRKSWSTRPRTRERSWEAVRASTSPVAERAAYPRLISNVQIIVFEMLTMLLLPYLRVCRYADISASNACKHPHFWHHEGRIQ